VFHQQIALFIPSLSGQPGEDLFAKVCPKVCVRFEASGSNFELTINVAQGPTLDELDDELQLAGFSAPSVKYCTGQILVNHRTLSDEVVTLHEILDLISPELKPTVRQPFLSVTLKVRTDEAVWFRSSPHSPLVVPTPNSGGARTRSPVNSRTRPSEPLSAAPVRCLSLLSVLNPVSLFRHYLQITLNAQKQENPTQRS
jgi:hypothetical protein